MKKATIWVLLSLLLGGAATTALGANLGAWALTAAPGEGTTEEPGKVTVGNFVAGTGVTSFAFGGSGAYGSGWSTAASPSTTNYFEVTVAPQAGYGLSISQIDYSERRSGTGIREFQVRISTNNFSSYVVLATNAVPDNDSERTYSMADLNLLVQEGRTFRLRFYGYLAEGSGGTWRINDNSLKIVGTAISMSGPPVVGFNPGSGVQVHVSNTLDVAVSVLPTGGIQSWWVAPTPAGTTNFSGGTFHFTPVAADDGQTFTLNMVATNSYGSSTGTLAIAVTEYLLPGTLEITFENAGEVKTSYDPETVTLSGEPWLFDQVRIGDAATDLKVGARAARFGSYYPAYLTSSNKLLAAGLGTISFLYAQYGGSEAGAELVVEVATNLTSGNWMEMGRVNANGVTTLTKYEVNVGISQSMHVRIRTEYVEGVGQVNVDNVVIAPYAAPIYSAYEQYLRQYNVTPGDSGTAPGEDWDGDGAINTNEFNALTNPYDPLSHP